MGMAVLVVVVGVVRVEVGEGWGRRAAAGEALVISSTVAAERE